jgi:hypothetical protein
MKNWMALTIGAAALALAAGTASAQEESDNRVAAMTAWSVFVEDDPTECWVVSKPESWQALRGGSDVTSDVRRGDILLFVTYRPGSGVAGEVSYTGGYPFRDESSVTLEIGDDSFDLFTQGEWAWPRSAEEDSRIVAALKAGVDATLTGVSARGTTTKDKFSLLGVTAALEEAERRCGG